MAIIQVSLNHPIRDGEEIIFKASCASSAAEGLKVTYPVSEEEGLSSKTLTFKDAHGTNISSTADIFTLGSYVTVVVDATNNAAYIQNADTNTYLEGKIPKVQEFSVTVATGWSGSAAPYSKATTVSGLLAADTPIIDLVPSSTFATAESQLEAWGYVYRAVTSANTLTLYATEKPTVALPIQLKVVRANG